MLCFKEEKKVPIWESLEDDVIFSLCFPESPPYLPAGLSNLSSKLNDKSRKGPSAVGTVTLKLPALIWPHGSAALFAELRDLF